MVKGPAAKVVLVNLRVKKSEFQVCKTEVIDKLQMRISIFVLSYSKAFLTKDPIWNDNQHSNPAIKVSVLGTIEIT